MSNDTFRNEVRTRVWQLLETLTADSSHAQRCVVRDEIVGLICDSPATWITKDGQVAKNDEDDFYSQKESWIAR